MPGTAFLGVTVILERSTVGAVISTAFCKFKIVSLFASFANAIVFNKLLIHKFSTIKIAIYFLHFCT